MRAHSGESKCFNLHPWKSGLRGKGLLLAASGSRMAVLKRAAPFRINPTTTERLFDRINRINRINRIMNSPLLGVYKRKWNERSMKH
jgi:hypothetical protein